MIWERSCTPLDHIYPRTTLGTLCYCGKRVWGQAAWEAPLLFQPPPQPLEADRFTATPAGPSTLGKTGD